ncbi:MAG: peptidoglycan DD-metalloendopeptidase family protein [Alphaproteobacteria bacterium]|nr:peptidoglycan DD-metalloendopeptidase family protein [Alphaproteobacteria bacterium]
MKRALFLFLGCSLSMGECAFATPPKKVIAGPDSTVYGIAYENGILTRALIAANNLKPPYVLQKGQELIIPSPNEHVVGQGETLKSIAEDYGVNVDVLAQENNVKPFRHGEALSIPSRDTESMAAALKSPVDNIATSSLEPLPSVKAIPLVGKVSTPVREPKPERALPNELAEEIAREKGIIASGNKTNAKEGRGSKPELMGNLAQGNAGAPTAATSTVQEEEIFEKPKKKEKPVENKEKPKKAEKAKEEEKSTSQKEKSQVEATEPEFSKPIEFTTDDILTKFSPGTNDGIKIKVPKGTAVKAAAAGDVLYAGSELEGYGNLLLLKHKGGWVTAYGYNSSLLVKKGDAVKKGQVIAKSGNKPDTKEALLHFEVRKGKQAVDPLPKLGS